MQTWQVQEAKAKMSELVKCSQTRPQDVAIRGKSVALDLEVTDRWGRPVADAGRPMPAINSLLAGTALQHGLILVTRNLKAFDDLPVEMFSPWSQ